MSRLRTSRKDHLRLQIPPSESVIQPQAIHATRFVGRQRVVAGRGMGAAGVGMYFLPAICIDDVFVALCGHSARVLMSHRRWRFVCTIRFHRQPDTSPVRDTAFVAWWRNALAHRVQWDV